MTTTADVVVVGLGATGGAVAYQLAAAGARVVGVDRHDPPHAQGSSHGDTRITRLAVGEGDAYVPLVRRSHELWREVEAATGEQLLVQCGGLVLGASGGGGQHGVGDFVATTIEIARRHGIEHDVLDVDEVRSRFGIFHVTDEVGYYEPSAGYLRAEACVAAQRHLAERHGATLHTGVVALGWARRGDGVRVETTVGPLDAGRVVVAAGPWLPELVPRLGSRLAVQRQVLYWFDAPVEPARFASSPVFIWFHGPAEGDLVYGFPAVDGPRGGVKLATESYGPTTTPATVDRTVSAHEARAFHRAHVRRQLPGVAPRCLRAAVCLYTVTPDFGFVVDALEDGRVLVVSPCSGHGFKHAAALGECVARLATGAPSPLDLSSFRVDRFD